MKQITGKELEKLLQESEKTVFCDFWAAWCGPCRMLAPVLDTLSDKYGDDAEFVKVNVDENEAVAAKFGITSIPNVLAFKNGKSVASSLGFVPEAQLETFIKNNL